MKIKQTIALTVAALVALTGCSAASTSTQNNRVAADNFEINRRIVFFNGITDTYLLEIQGYCSISDETGMDGGAQQVEVICKVDEKNTKRHILGLSDNVSYFVEQIDAAPSGEFHYRVIFRPETIVPNVDVETSNG